MSLTPSQLATLKAAILNDPALSAQPMSNLGSLAIAAALNELAVPDFIVGSTSVSRHDIQTKTSLAGTTFTWGGTQGGYINRSPGELSAWREMFNESGRVDPREPNIIAAFNDIFSGAGSGAQANRAHIAAMCKRKATYCEKILATGAGTLQNPAVLNFVGTVTIDEVQQARELP